MLESLDTRRLGTLVSGHRAQNRVCNAMLDGMPWSAGGIRYTGRLSDSHERRCASFVSGACVPARALRASRLVCLLCHFMPSGDVSNSGVRRQVGA